MKAWRRAALVGFLTLASSAAFAQAPNVLPPPRPAHLKQVKPTAIAQVDASNNALSVAANNPAQAAPFDPATAVEKANAYFNSVSSLVSDFVQVGADGRRSEGRLYLQKPGKIRFEYEPPSTLQVVSDGTSVVVRDRKLNTQDMYSIGQTPLKFLLKERIDLSRDAKVLSVSNDRDLVSLVVEDRATLGGTSRITLMMDPRDYSLKRWIIRDPQGYETSVALSNVEKNKRPDPNAFRIIYERLRTDTN